jgi:diketogulonate reductase-like aldo/keto reductase
MKTVRLKDGTPIPALGFGTWYLGESSQRNEREIEALQYGIEHGMTLIDTAEMYGEGAAEELVGKAIRPYEREKLFLVSKVYPWNAGKDHIFTSCENSLKRLGTDYLDLYLLHWNGNVPYEETINCMEKLIRQGKIRRWGVSNLDTEDMEALIKAGGENCQTDQVLYHLGSRGVEYDLLPWLRKHGMPLMAYSPLGHSAAIRRRIIDSPAVRQAAEAHRVSVYQVMLAFVLRQDNVFAVVKASSEEHVKDNLASTELQLTTEEYAAIDAAFPAPKRKTTLDML